MELVWTTRVNEDRMDLPDISPLQDLKDLWRSEWRAKHANISNWRVSTEDPSRAQSVTKARAITEDCSWLLQIVRSEVAIELPHSGHTRREQQMDSSSVEWLELPIRDR